MLRQLPSNLSGKSMLLKGDNKCAFTCDPPQSDIIMLLTTEGKWASSNRALFNWPELKPTILGTGAWMLSPCLGVNKLLWPADVTRMLPFALNKSSEVFSKEAFLSKSPIEEHTELPQLWVIPMPDMPSKSQAFRFAKHDWGFCSFPSAVGFLSQFLQMKWHEETSMSECTKPKSIWLQSKSSSQSIWLLVHISTTKINDYSRASDSHTSKQQSMYNPCLPKNIL